MCKNVINRRSNNEDADLEALQRNVTSVAPLKKTRNDRDTSMDKEHQGQGNSDNRSALVIYKTLWSESPSSLTTETGNISQAHPK